jgi:predicted nucleic acid-binding protein
VRVLLDTSVVVAALLPGHPSHGEAIPWLSRAKSGAFEFLFSAHSLAEVYAVLTRIPISPPITPKLAGKLIQENITSVANICTLTGEQYVALVDEMIDKSLGGGAVYDGIIAKVAEVANADLLVTLNVDHFHRIWPTNAAKIVAPGTMPAL